MNRRRLRMVLRGYRLEIAIATSYAIYIAEALACVVQAGASWNIFSEFSR